MQIDQSRANAIGLGALGVLLYVLWLGARDVWYPGEPDLAEISGAMFASGDWIVPRRNGEVFLNYGPLFFWASTFVSHLLGGMSDFALRLPNALAGVAIVVATSLVGSRWFGTRAGLWAGLLMLASWEFTWQAIGFRVDVLFSLFVVLGMFTYASGAGPDARWTPRIAGFALLGLAILVKGPLGLLLPGLVLVLWHAARREWRAILEMAPLALVAIAVAVPWYIAVAGSLGADSVVEELMAQSFNRFESGASGHGRPAYYYLVRIWLDLTLWAVLLPFAGLWIYERKLWQDRRIQLALWWFGTFFVFLSLAATKRKLYLIPAYPAAALLLATWISAVTETNGDGSSPSPRPARIFALCGWILFAVLAVASLVAAATLGLIVGRLDVPQASQEVFLDLRLPLLAIGLTCSAVWLWIGRARRDHDLEASLRRLALGQILFYLLAVAWVLPTLNPLNTYAPHGRWVAERAGPEGQIGYLGSKRKIGAFAYYAGRTIERVESEADVERFFREHPDGLVLAEEKRSRELFSSEKTDWPARVVHEFDAARRSYRVLRGP